MRKLLIIVWIIMLTGCINSKMNMVPAYSPEQTLADDHGVVIARVLNASAYPYDFNYITLTPKNVYETKENKFQRLLSLKTVGTKSSFFTSQVEAGEYSLSDVYSYYNFGNYYYQLFGPAKPAFGTFKVEPGKVTDLGTIIYYQKFDDDVYYHVVNRKNDQGVSLALFQQHAPALAKKITPAATLTWDEDEHLDDRNDLYLNIAQNPIVHNNAYPQVDGSWVFTSPLGMMLKRDKDGEWGLEGVETDYDLIHYSQNQQGNQLVSAADNSIYFNNTGLKSDEDSWQVVTPPDTDQLPGGSENDFDMTAIQLLDNNDVIVFYHNKYFIIAMRLPAEQVGRQYPPSWEAVLIYNKLDSWTSPNVYAKNEEKCG